MHDNDLSQCTDDDSGYNDDIGVHGWDKNDLED